ncbi:hypothetical protein BC941DRAFT_399213 [Chlamydoabsidia padenii]|nr:hypothetical protein BC941DRAFT_399213 [Chlamydoabsidia padenii]
MSSNNNRSNRNNQNGGNDVNRIRGPTSALSSFLREHGIHVENRSRREMAERRRRQREAEATGNDDPAATPNATDSGTAPTTPDSSAAPTTPTTTNATVNETILYAPRTRSSLRTRSAQDQAIMDSATSSKSSLTKTKKKKRPLGDDDSDDDDFMDPQPSSSRPRAPTGRMKVLFCSKCKLRFTRGVSDTSEETMCPRCVSGKDPASTVKAPKKRIHTHGGNKKAWYMHGVQTSSVLPSLQDSCIKVITDHIDDVEALGNIGIINMDKIAKIICRNRQLTNRTALLFMQPQLGELSLYDCTNVDVTGLKNIAHFCPNLRTLNLQYCGRMTDEVLELYGSHLQSLTSITLTGCHLVTENQWIKFFETIGDRLEGFSVRHTNRFKLGSMKALVTNCNKLHRLGLSRIVTISDDWATTLSDSDITTLESLELGQTSTDPGSPYTLTTGPLIKVLEKNGGSLKELSLYGCTDMTDELLVNGILPHCTQLQKLVLDGCNQLTSDAFKSLFSNDWKLRPTIVHRRPVVGLHHVAVARCLNFDDDALKALLGHSGKALTHLDIHSLENLTATALESIAGDEGDNDEKEKNFRFITDGKDKGNKYKRFKIGSTPDSLTKTVPSACTSLAYLDTSFVRSMDDYVLAKLIRSCSNLKRINVWGCHQITDTIQVPRQLIIEGREFVPK